MQRKWWGRCERGENVTYGLYTILIRAWCKMFSFFSLSHFERLRSKCHLILNITLTSMEFSTLFHEAWEEVYMGSQVSSPTHLSKSPHGGKVPTCEPKKSTKVQLMSIKVKSLLFYAKTSQNLCWELSLVYLMDPTLKASPKSHLSKVLPCRRTPMSYLGFRTLDPYEVVSPNFHTLNSWDPTNRPQVTLDLGLGNMCELALKYKGICLKRLFTKMCMLHNIIQL